MELPKDVLELIRIYRNAQARLIDTIAKAEAKGNVTQFQKNMLVQINAQLRTLDNRAAEWTRSAIPDNYNQGVQYVNTQLGYSTSFSVLHTEAIRVLSQNTYNDLHDANNFVGRQIFDSIRKASMDAISQKLSTGETVKQVKSNLVQSLVDQGIGGIKDKKGRIINLAAYAEMVARSTTREATNKATMNQMKELGHDLVKMSEHRTTCKLCSTMQGRVYSISGRDSRFPPLSRAFSGTNANIHPNCRHVLMPYIEGLEDVAKDIQISNKSFDVEPRDQQQIDQYNRQQKQKRQLRDNRRDWERTKLLLPKDAPKSLSAFQRMKKSNSKKWQKLQDEMNSDIINIRNRIATMFNGVAINSEYFGAIEKAFEEVLKFGKINNIENLYHLDLKTGKKGHDTLTGTGNQVVLTPELIKYLDSSPDSTVLSIHNHPRSSSFSDADMNVTAHFKSIDALTVIAHDGTMYMLKIDDGKRPDEKEIAYYFNSIKNNYNNEYYTKVQNREMTADQAWKEHSHKINQDLAKKYNWEYRRVLPDEK